MQSVNIEVLARAFRKAAHDCGDSLKTYDLDRKLAYARGDKETYADCNALYNQEVSKLMMLKSMAGTIGNSFILHAVLEGANEGEQAAAEYYELCGRLAERG